MGVPVALVLSIIVIPFVVSMFASLAAARIDRFIESGRNRSGDSTKVAVSNDRAIALISTAMHMSSSAKMLGIRALRQMSIGLWNAALSIGCVLAFLGIVLAIMLVWLIKR